MSSVTSFVTNCGKYKFSVKAEFYKSCPNPTEYSIYDLMTKHKVNQYFHSTSGPALTRLKDMYEEYWVDGMKVSEEEGKRMAHNFKFNDKLMKEIEQ